MKALFVMVSFIFAGMAVGCSHHGKHGEKDKSCCEGKKECGCSDGECKDGSCDMKKSDKKDCGCGKDGQEAGKTGHKTDIETDKKIGSTSASLMNGHVFVGAAPKEMKDYVSAKEAGITAIIDLRSEKEFKRKAVQKAVMDAGLSYVHIPMSKNGKIEKDAIDKIELAVHGEGKAEKVWIYCASGNRASAWVAIHAAKVHGESQEKALNFATATGLKNDMKTKVQEYWKQNP